MPPKKAKRHKKPILKNTEQSEGPPYIEMLMRIVSDIHNFFHS